MTASSKIYLDYAATTPVDPQVVSAMLPYMTGEFGNASSLHSFGRNAKIAMEEARVQLAGYLGAKPDEIIFTSSATESNNLAVKGLCFAVMADKLKQGQHDKFGHIIVSSIEHDCVLNSAKWLAGMGFEITLAPVDKYGMVDPKDVEKLLREDTIVVSVMHANNEMGTILPIAEIGKICCDRGVTFHTDASQTFGKMKMDVNELKVDLLTASSQKIYGPKGVALLYMRGGTSIWKSKLVPILHGGGHENGLRSSTSNVSGIVGFAKAAEIAHSTMAEESARVTKLRDKLIKKVLHDIPNSYLNGHPTQRLYNNANFRFDHIEGEALIMSLDIEGFAVSTASACSSPKLEPSHVLLATGLKHEEAHGSLRVSLGRWTTEEEIDKFLEVLPKVVERLRAISPLGK